MRRGRQHPHQPPYRADDAETLAILLSVVVLGFIIAVVIVIVKG